MQARYKKEMKLYEAGTFQPASKKPAAKKAAPKKKEPEVGGGGYCMYASWQLACLAAAGCSVVQPDPKAGALLCSVFVDVGCIAGAPHIVGCFSAAAGAGASPVVVGRRLVSHPSCCSSTPAHAGPPPFSVLCAGRGGV